MSELWDLLDLDGNPTGETFERHVDAPKLPEGRSHLVVVAWIYFNGRFLLEQRSYRKHYGGGEWSIPGGSCCSGETSLTAVIREVREETGITLAKGDAVTFLTREAHCDFICDSWLFILDPSKQIQSRLNAEVESFKLCCPNEASVFVREGYLHKHSRSYLLACNAIHELGLVSC